MPLPNLEMDEVETLAFTQDTFTSSLMHSMVVPAHMTAKETPDSCVT